MDKKNVLLIVPTLQLGGQERVAVNTAEIMSDLYNITFVVFDGRNAVYTPPCQVIDLAIPATPRKMTKITNVLLRAHALRMIKRKKGIDFTLSFGTTANMANVLSGYPDRTFLTIHGYGDVSQSLIGTYLYRQSKKIGCVSKVIEMELSNLYHLPAGKAVAIYNPYDFVEMREQAEKTVTDYIFTPHTIVTHGRLDEVKNYPRLIKAFSLVHEQVPEAQLLIIGEGAERPKLESLIAAYHTEDSVTLMGFRKNPFAYLSKSSLYVLSSYSEGFPNALVEGMTFLPAVSVDCKTGPREILSNGDITRVCKRWEEADYGILVPPAEKREFCADLTDDDHILAEAIISVLTDPVKAKALQEKAQSRVKAFSYEAYRENLMKIFED